MMIGLAIYCIVLMMILWVLTIRLLVALLHLMDLRSASEEVSAKLKEDGLSLEMERDLLAQKVHLDTQIRDTLAHFGTVILP